MKTTKEKWKKIATIAISSGMSQALSFVFGLLLVRILPIADYAVYRQGMLIVNTLCPFFCVLSPISLSYFFAKADTEEEKQYYVKQTLFSLGLISIIGSFGVYFFRGAIGKSYNNQLLSSYMIYFAIILLVESSTQFFAYYMVCINREKVLVGATVVFSLLKMLALVAAIIIGHNYLKAFLLIYIFIEIVKGIFMFVYTLVLNNGIAFHLNRGRLKAQLVFSLPVFIMGIINALNTNLDKNIVAMLFSPEKYAIYENGAYQIPFIGVLSSSIISVMLPDIAKKYKEGNRLALDKIIREYRHVIKVSFGILSSIFLSILVFSKGIVVLLFSEKYLASLPIFRNYLFMLLLQSLNLGVLLTSANKQKEIVKSGIIMIASNFTFLILISVLGQFENLVFAPILATILMNMCLLFSIKRIYKQTSIWNVIPISFIFKLILPDAAVCVIFAILANTISLNVIFKTVILGPVCFFVLLSMAFLIMKLEDKNKGGEEI